MHGLGSGIRTHGGRVVALQPFPEGEVYTLFRGELEGDPKHRSVLVKCSHGADVDDLVENEIQILRHMDTQNIHASRGIRMTFPELIDTFTLNGRPGLVTDFAEGYYTLAEVRRAYPDGVPAPHVAWMFNRMMAALIVAHTSGVIHGNVLPGNFLIFSGTEQDALRHTGVLVDWTVAVQEIRTAVWPKLSAMSGDPAHAAFYPPEVRMREPASPATDLAMAAGCAIYLLGGDIETGEVPGATPWNIAQLLRSCRVANPAQRPRSLAVFYEQFQHALAACFGPSVFRELPLPPCA